MKILKGLLSLLLCLCLITPMGSAIVALNDGGIADMGSQANSGSPTSAPSVTPAPSDTDTPVEAPDYAALYNDLMAAATFAEAHALLEGLTDEQLSAFIDSLTEEQYAALEEHIDALIAAAEEDGDLEYVYTTVNFTNVAPLLDPVCGSPTRGASVSGDDTGSGNNQDALVLTKNANVDEDGNYVITIEAYTTGSVTPGKKIPADIVLVLDVSGSMDSSFTSSDYEQYPSDTSNFDYYYYYKDDLYYKTGDDVYEEVSIEHSTGGTYKYYIGSSATLLVESSGFYISPGITLYKKVMTTRLIALKTAVNSFIDKVADSASVDKVGHRISIVKFAGNNRDTIGNDMYREGSYYYNYSQIVCDLIDASSQRNTLKDYVNSFQAGGATQIDLGLNHANTVFERAGNSGDERARVVIVFTDGSPTSNRDFEPSVANDAISNANTIKNRFNATVYTIGIFDGADASSKLPEADTSPERENRFMHLVSSNYPKATSMTSPGESSDELANGKSYYLSAGGESALNEIFNRIGDEVSAPDIVLGSETVIKDIVSECFEVPSSDSIHVYTADFQGDGSWKDRSTFDATISFGESSEDTTVFVSGFDFDKNFVSDTPRKENEDDENSSFYGRKLIIEFTVKVKAGFLGGNNVFTNGENSGVYPNSTTDKYIKLFNRPQVNVPIGDVSVTASDKNVYLLNGLTAAQLKEGATVKVGDVTLNLAPDATNYGLELWQTEYVDISVVITDASGNAVTVGIDELSDDTTYSITVTVSPKPEYTGFDKDGNLLPGTLATQQSGYDEGTINVFKPFLTFADSEVWYGGQYTDYTANYKSVAWKHGTDEANTETMGNAPELTLDYATTPENAIVEGYIAVPDDIPVNVSVKIGETDIDDHVSFVHADCSHENCGFDAEACEFILHVNTCSLTVEKAIAEGKLQDSDQSFIFKVSYPGIKVGEVTILPSAEYNVLIVGAGSRTIVGLPVGSYTVRENTDWSWRYELVEGQNGVLATLPAESPEEAIVTMTNRLNNEFWLSDEAVATNVFDSNGSGIVYNPTPAIIPGKEDLTDEAD
ncbi:MAG: VWA domain-containing protein [Clostridium sp.]|nr:VWA domain-containing protein [Clostridium sp.]